MGKKRSHSLTCFIQIGEEYRCCRICLWTWKQAQDKFGNHSKRSFGADEELNELIAYRAFEDFSSQMKNAAICQHDRHSQDIILGDTILEATWPSGITGNISSEGALHQAIRIGRLKQSK